MPIGYEAISLGDVSYYDIGGSVENIDKDTLARTLGPSNKVRSNLRACVPICMYVYMTITYMYYHYA